MRNVERDMKCRNEKGLTIFECLLAIALGAIILVPLTLTFKVARQSWKENSERSDITQSARIAMNRIMTELRYSTLLKQADSTLEFDTMNLLAVPATILYVRTGTALWRRVDGEFPGKELVGGSWINNVAYANASAFTCTPYKVDTGSNNALVPLDIGDTLADDAVAVEVALTIEDEFGETITVTSLANLRN